MCISNKNCGCSCNKCSSGFNCCVEYTEDGCGESSLPLKCSNYSGEDISCGDLSITRADTGDEAIKKLADKICEVADSNDIFVKVNAADTTSSYLFDKIVGSQYVKLSVINPNLNEKIKIDLNLADLLTAVNAQLPVDKFVRITANDKTSGYLANKLVSGDGVKLVIQQGNDETLTLSVSLSLSTIEGNQLTIDNTGKLFVPPMPVYYPILGKVVRNDISTKGWFNLDKSDVGNPFYGTGSLGSGASGFASFEGPVNGWVLMGQDGINTFTGQTFDLYGALKNPAGGFYPSVRIWHSGNVVEGTNVDFTQNDLGQTVISANGQRFGYPGEDVVAIEDRDVQFGNKHFYISGIGDLDFKTTIADSNNYNFSHFELTNIGGVINYYKKNVSTDNYAQVGVIESPNSILYPAGAQMSAVDNISQISNTINVSADKIVIGDRFLSLPATTTDIQLKRIANTLTANVLYYNSSTGSVTYGAAPTGGGNTVSADNGLTKTSDNIQLGGKLLHDTRINTDIHRFIISSDGPTRNDSETILEIQRNTSSPSVAQNGIGASLDFGIETTLGIATVSTRLTSRWVDVTDATRTAQFEIQGVHQGIFVDHLKLTSLGQLILPQYNTPTSFVGTAVAGLGYDNAGKVIAIPLSSGGGSSSVAAENALHVDGTSGKVMMGGLFTLPQTTLGTFDASNYNSNLQFVFDNASGETARTLSTGIVPYDSNIAYGIKVDTEVGSAIYDGSGGARPLGLDQTQMDANAPNGKHRSLYFGGGQAYSNTTHDFEDASYDLDMQSNNSELQVQMRLNEGSVQWGVETFSEDLTDSSIYGISALRATAANGVAGYSLEVENADNSLYINSPTDYTGGNTHFLPISVNGNFADAAGNITLDLSGAGPTITADNGLTKTLDNIQLGSLTNSGVPLSTTRFINTAGNTLRVRGTTSLYPLYAENLGTGFGAYLESQNNAGAQIATYPSTTNTVAPVLNVSRASSGTAASGIGGSIDWYNQTVANGNVYSGSVAMKWIDAANATRSSQFEVTLNNNAVTARKLAIKPTGQLQLDSYTSDTSFTGTPVANLSIDSSGNVVTTTIAGASSITANNGLTMSTSTNAQLGGTLLHDTTVNGGTFNTLFTSARTGASGTVNIDNSSSGHGLISTASGAGYGVYGIGQRGVFGTSPSGYGVRGESTSGVGIYGATTTGITGMFSKTPTTFNDVTSIISVNRFTSGNSQFGASGIGGAIEFSAPTTTQLSSVTGGTIAWKWSDAIDASRTGQFEINLVNNAGSLTRKMAIAGNGDIIIDNIRSYANDAAADADGTLPVGALYKITGSRVVYHKPIGT